MGKKKNKVRRYDINKAAKVGETLNCPTCQSLFVKKSYQQAFCCTECKDKWWNTKRKNNGYFRRYNIENPERLERVGINLDEIAEDYAMNSLGDPEWESLAQITLDPDSTQRREEMGIYDS